MLVLRINRQLLKFIEKVLQLVHACTPECKLAELTVQYIKPKKNY